jgi:hypothetical protein
MRCRAALCALLLAFLPRAAAADVRVFDSEVKGLPVHVDLYGFAAPRLAVQENDTRPEVEFTPNPAFTLARARLGVIGALSDRAELRFEMELGKDFSQGIDAYIEGKPFVHPMATVGVRFGQFRVPFSRQNLIRSSDFQLPDPAYFVTAKYLVDRDIGAMVLGRFWRERIRLSAGIFNGNDPGRGQTINVDPFFLYAARLEVAPLAPPPRFEGDLRDEEERHKIAVLAGGGVMFNTIDAKHYNRFYVGGDAGVWFEGASLYAEIYRREDRANCFDDASKGAVCPAGISSPPPITAEGWNIQAGYFPHLPWVHQHVEIVARVERFDPYVEVTQPGHDAGERDLDQSNPTWGYLGYVFGLNVFPLSWGHNLKVQASYEIRNELKRCLVGQSGSGCTGYINNNLFLLQGTVGF